MMQRLLTAVFGAAMLLVLLGGCADPEPGVATQRLVIASSGAEHIFHVEVAETDEMRRRGLMFREELPEDGGMLFDFETSRVVTMWMRNTPLPLDMIFITRSDTGVGRIAHIAENTVPFSETIVSSRYPVSAVLEVNAGTARALGITTGDTVRHALFEAGAGSQAAE